MTDQHSTDRPPVVRGAVAGVAAYLAGYLLTYLATSSTMEERLSGFNFVANVFGGEPIAVWQGVGWLFYNAHFVSTRITGGLTGTRSVNFIAQSDSSAAMLLYLVPVLFLLAAGLFVARQADATEPSEAATAGATVIAGYLPLAVVGRFLFSYDGSIAPDIVTAILLAGAVYPLVVGAVGGAAWAMLAPDENERNPSPERRA